MGCFTAILLASGVALGAVSGQWEFAIVLCIVALILNVRGMSKRS